MKFYIVMRNSSFPNGPERSLCLIFFWFMYCDGDPSPTSGPKKSGSGRSGPRGQERTLTDELTTAPPPPPRFCPARPFSLALLGVPIHLSSQLAYPTPHPPPMQVPWLCHPTSRRLFQQRSVFFF